MESMCQLPSLCKCRHGSLWFCLKPVAYTSNGGKYVTLLDLGVILNVFCHKYIWYMVFSSCYNQDWSLLGGSYSNNTVVFFCPVGTYWECSSHYIPALDNKSLKCCCHNSLPTVITPLNYHRHLALFAIHLNRCEYFNAYGTVIIAISIVL